MTASGAHLAMRETGAAPVSRCCVVMVIPAASGLPLQEGQGGRVRRASATRGPHAAANGPSRQLPVGGALIAAARNVIAQRRAASPATGVRLAGTRRL